MPSQEPKIKILFASLSFNPQGMANWLQKGIVTVVINGFAAPLNHFAEHEILPNQSKKGAKGKLVVYICCYQNS